jgi:hypothetical protein
MAKADAMRPPRRERAHCVGRRGCPDVEVLQRLAGSSCWFASDSLFFARGIAFSARSPSRPVPCRCRGKKRLIDLDEQLMLASQGLAEAIDIKDERRCSDF